MKIIHFFQNRMILQKTPALFPWIQKTLYRRAGNCEKLIISRSYISVTSTIFLILASLLPYTDLLLSPIIDLNTIKLKRFANVSVAIWSYSMCVSPLLILAASKFQPYKFSYIIPCYVYTTMFCGFFFLELNIHIHSDWIFRLITLFLSIIILCFARIFINIFKTVRIKEDVMNEFINLKNNG